MIKFNKRVLMIKDKNTKIVNLPIIYRWMNPLRLNSRLILNYKWRSIRAKLNSIIYKLSGTKKRIIIKKKDILE